MMKMIMLIVAVSLISSCARIPVDQSSIDTAMQSIAADINGTAVNPESLFFSGAVYFNGKENSGEALHHALREDFDGVKTFSLKNQYPGPPINQSVTVYTADEGHGAGSCLVAAWHKIRGKWTILFLSKSDESQGLDMREKMKAYQKTFNNHNIAGLIDSFYSDDVIRVITSNTVRGKDVVRRGYAVAENDPLYVNSWIVEGQYSLGKEYQLTIGEIREHKSKIIMKFIYVWKILAGEEKLVINFDYK